MPRTSILFLSILLVGSLGTARAKTDPACLKHLGGGYSDTECYSGMSIELVSQNERLYKRLRATIPPGNVHAKLLDEYMQTEDYSLKYCELQRNAGVKWETKHDGSMYPALYEQCVYELRKSQHKFLSNLLEMTSWK